MNLKKKINKSDYFVKSYMVDGEKVNELYRSGYPIDKVENKNARLFLKNSFAPFLKIYSLVCCALIIIVLESFLSHFMNINVYSVIWIGTLISLFLCFGSNKGNDMSEYNKKDMLKNFENSKNVYLLEKPEDVSQKDWNKIIKKCIKNYNQQNICNDAAYYIIDSNNDFFKEINDRLEAVNYYKGLVKKQ